MFTRNPYQYAYILKFKSNLVREVNYLNLNIIYLRCQQLKMGVRNKYPFVSELTDVIL